MKNILDEKEKIANAETALAEHYQKLATDAWERAAAAQNVSALTAKAYLYAELDHKDVEEIKQEAQAAQAIYNELKRKEAVQRSIIPKFKIFQNADIS